MSARLKRIARRLVAMVIGLVVAVLLAEIVLSFVWTAPSRELGTELADAGLFRRDTACGWLMEPSVAVEHNTHWGDTVWIRTNSHGYRDSERSKDGATKPRVAVLGDSFPFGFGVEVEDAFPQRLQELLPDAEVLNFGETGHHTAMTHALLRDHVLAWQPKVVLLAFCMNDVVEQVIPESRSRRRPAKREGLKAWLSDNSALYGILRAAVLNSKPMARFMVSIGLRDGLHGFEAMDPNIRPFLRRPPAQMKTAWEQTLAELRAMHATCENAGVTLVVAAIPTKESVLPGALDVSLQYIDFEPADFDLAKGFERLQEFCIAASIGFANPRRAFLDAIQAEQELYLTDDMHFNPAGHRLFAEQVVGAVNAALRE
jgi:lysophospholipase L1-like esterase